MSMHRFSDGPFQILAIFVQLMNHLTYPCGVWYYFTIRAYITVFRSKDISFDTAILQLLRIIGENK